MDADPSRNLPGKRLQLLLNQLQAKWEKKLGKGERSGAVSRAARETGLHTAHFGQLRDGLKLADWETVQKVKDRMRIRDDFFTDKSLKDPVYSDYFEAGPRPIDANEPTARSNAAIVRVIHAYRVKHHEQAILISLGELLETERDYEIAIAVIRAMKLQDMPDEEVADQSAAAVANTKAEREGRALQAKTTSSAPPPKRRTR